MNSTDSSASILVSVVTPVYNAEKYLDEALESVFKQTWRKSLEISVYNDASTDNSLDILLKWKNIFQQNGIAVVVGSNSCPSPGGVGRSRNQAILQSHGRYLCFFDADDIMLPRRLECQLAAASEEPNMIVGCQFVRFPEDATPRYTNWSNSLSPSQLHTQIYTSFGPTIIQPSWFCERAVFDRVGPFCEDGKGVPEDLMFFYKHLRGGGKISRVDECLLVYRYHSEAATFSVKQETIWDLRVKTLQQDVLSSWQMFTIWNAGKQGRRFLRALSPSMQLRVVAFCDVDERKIKKGIYTCEFGESTNGKKRTIPIVHYRQAKPPFIICVKLDMTGGVFESNLASLNLIEGQDYVHFN